MTDIRDWSTNPASNNGSPPVGAPEGQTAGSINNCLREMMAYTVQEAQANRVKTLTSVTGTNTITASMTPALTSYVNGMVALLTPSNTTTSLVTININSIGAVAVVNKGGTSLAGNELLSGVTYILSYDGTQFRVLNPSPTVATFTATLNAVSVIVTGTFNYIKDRQTVTIYSTASLSGTSTGAGPNISGIPSSIAPNVGASSRTNLGVIEVIGAGNRCFANAYYTTSGGAQISWDYLSYSSGSSQLQPGGSPFGPGTVGLPGYFRLSWQAASES